MFNVDNHQNKIKYLLIALAVILVAVVAIVAYKTNRAIKNENTGVSSQSGSRQNTQTRQAEGNQSRDNAGIKNESVSSFPDVNMNVVPNNGPE